MCNAVSSVCIFCVACSRGGESHIIRTPIFIFQSKETDLYFTDTITMNETSNVPLEEHIKHNGKQNLAYLW